MKCRANVVQKRRQRGCQAGGRGSRKLEYDFLFREFLVGSPGPLSYVES